MTDMLEQHFIDKSQWSHGEWTTEPDRVLWTDKETGYPCLIKRHPRSGFLCGYVGVPKSHPYYGRDLSGCDFDDDICVHGGITYAEECDGDEEKGICHKSNDGDDEVYWIGFDCAHSNDLFPYYPMGEMSLRTQFGEIYRNIDYVKKECASLASQLKEKELANAS